MKQYNTGRVNIFEFAMPVAGNPEIQPSEGKSEVGSKIRPINNLFILMTWIVLLVSIPVGSIILVKWRKNQV
jgi:hypothetical protein